MQNFKLSIPTPCQEDWQEMTSQEKGRFCNACSKIVIDFTNMTEQEIVAYFQAHENKEVCGKVLKKQLDTVYQPQNFLEKHYIHVYQNYRKSWIGAKYLSILSLVLLIASCQNPENQVKSTPINREVLENILDVEYTTTLELPDAPEIPKQEFKAEELIPLEAMELKNIEARHEIMGVMIIEEEPLIIDTIMKIDTIKTEGLLEIADSSSSVVSKINLDFSELSIYPNPVQDKATIRYFLKIDSDVKIHLLDGNGRLVKAFLHETQKAGEHRLDIDIQNLPSGVYFYTLETNSHKESKRLIVAK